MANIQRVHGEIDLAQREALDVENLLEQFVSQHRTEIDAFQGEVNKAVYVPDEKKASVLTELRDTLTIELPQEERPDPEMALKMYARRLGEVESRLTVLKYIFDPAVRAKMLKQRRIVEKARAKDEVNEPEYINRLEGKYHIQIHGMLSEQEALEFKRAFARIAPQYRDLIELIPDITFVAQPQGSGAQGAEGGHTTPHDFRISFNTDSLNDSALHEGVIDHELAHVYQHLIILVDALKGAAAEKTLTGRLRAAMGPVPVSQRQKDALLAKLHKDFPDLKRGDDAIIRRAMDRDWKAIRRCICTSAESIMADMREIAEVPDGSGAVPEAPKSLDDFAREAALSDEEVGWMADPYVRRYAMDQFRRAGKGAEEQERFHKSVAAAHVFAGLLRERLPDPNQPITREWIEKFYTGSGLRQIVEKNGAKGFDLLEAAVSSIGHLDFARIKYIHYLRRDEILAPRAGGDDAIRRAEMAGKVAKWLKLSDEEARQLYLSRDGGLERYEEMQDLGIDAAEAKRLRGLGREEYDRVKFKAAADKRIAQMLDEAEKWSKDKLAMTRKFIAIFRERGMYTKGTLEVLRYYAHIGEEQSDEGIKILAGLDDSLQAGRYHSCLPFMVNDKDNPLVAASGEEFRAQIAARAMDIIRDETGELESRMSELAALLRRGVIRDSEAARLLRMDAATYKATRLADVVRGAELQRSLEELRGLKKRDDQQHYNDPAVNEDIRKAVVKIAQRHSLDVKKLDIGNEGDLVFLSGYDKIEQALWKQLTDVKESMGRTEFGPGDYWDTDGFVSEYGTTEPDDFRPVTLVNTRIPLEGLVLPQIDGDPRLALPAKIALEAAYRLISARPRSDFDFATKTVEESLAFVRKEVSRHPEDFNFGGVVKLADVFIPGFRQMLSVAAGVLRDAVRDPSKIALLVSFLKTAREAFKQNPIFAAVPQIERQLGHAIRVLDEMLLHPETIPQDVIRKAADIAERLVHNPSSVTFADWERFATFYPVMGRTLQNGVQFKFQPEQLSTIVEQYALDPERVVREVWLSEKDDRCTGLKLFKYPRSRRVLGVMQEYGFLPRHL